MTASPTTATTTTTTTTTTSSSSHTPLETLLLFRAVAHFGLDDASFTRIADTLRANKLLRNAASYDPCRLTADALRDLFLRVVREELTFSDADKTPGPDGALSPASKKRRLEPPPLLSLKDARQHIARIEAAYARIHDVYVKHAVGEVQQYERAYEALVGEIKDLEKTVPEAPEPEPELESKPQLQQPQTQPQTQPLQGPNGVQAPGRPKPAATPNGAAPSPVASPRPPQPPTPHALPHPPLRNLQPLLPAQQAPPQPPPAQTQPQPSPRPPLPPSHPNQQPPPAGRAPGTSRHPPPNGTTPVLQAPQGAAPFQPSPSPAAPAGTDGLQRPDGVPAPRQAPAFSAPSPQPPAQGQLKWEPPYQPANAPPAQAAGPAGPPAVPPQRPQQPIPAPPGPALPQAQPGRPMQAAPVPPHPASQFAAALQSPAASAAARPPQFVPAPAAGAPPQQSQLHPPYAGPAFSATGQAPPAPPLVPAPAPQAAAAAAASGAARGAGVAATAAPAGSVPRPGPGVAAPSPRPQASAVLQAPAAQPNAPPARPDAADPRHSSPYNPPRPGGSRPPAVATPTPAARFGAAPGPRTPNVGFPMRIAGGSGTKWVSTSTPSTPRPGIELRLGYDDVPSPAYEPTSPVLHPAPLSATRDAEKREEPSETPKPKAGASRPVPRHPTASHEKKPSQAGSDMVKVKEEAGTPRLTTETGDTTADESVTGRTQPSRSSKRKRDDLTPTPAQTPRASQMREALPEGLVPGESPTLVLWTRSFNKVCGSAMEQIIHHRSANMFAQPIREKDAPGYHKVIKQPTDLKSIRAAINHGNRAAQAAAHALPDGGDPGTSSVWLPRTEDLVPPRSIINSSQLDRELAHMFSNAIMYNPDPNHGPGPAFLRDNVESDADGAGGDSHHQNQDSGVLGYQVDEFGVVNDARGMFVEVEKLLSELRSAEVRRNVPPSAVAAAAAAAAAALAAANAASAPPPGGSDREGSGESQRGESSDKDGAAAGGADEKHGDGAEDDDDDDDEEEEEEAHKDEEEAEVEEEEDDEDEEEENHADNGREEEEPEGSAAAAVKRRRVARG
ncbi:hypothetical protein VTJ83DRAFT_6913 [Remersonia thermophila]|uniref:Bromo domain-containing protein n=1 Tax=Remersonia thermophila TaxID=72144 RepID=A0ABR4D643_9PEZI